MDADAVNQKTEQFARMILNYLQRNPDAGDTLEGIAKWWLELERIESTVEEVANVLERLLEARVVEAHRITSGATVYKISDHSESAEIPERPSEFSRWR